jgi:hypothetical protein
MQIAAAMSGNGLSELICADFKMADLMFHAVSERKN